MKIILLIAITASCLTSCVTDTEELKYALQKKNEKYIERQKRWKMRKEAREERNDAWFDRVMH